MLPGQETADLCFETIQSEPRRVALLIGAGCSSTAGIPLANRIVDEVWQSYGQRCQLLPPEKQRSYNSVVGRLKQREFLRLLRPHLENAKVNLAHLCIAELVRQNIVDRVLTTNFDSLLIRACAMAGVYPAVYDCVAVPRLERTFGNELPAIYYLHGQTYGLQMLNSPEELEVHSSQVRDVVHHNIKERTLIVVGYSGTCDGVLEMLQTAHTEYPVFWVPFTHTDAKDAIKALSNTDYRWVLANHDADEFFYELLLALKLNAPVITRDVNLFAGESRRQIKLPNWFPFSRAERTKASATEPAAPAEASPDEINTLPPPPSPGWIAQKQAQPASTGT